MTGFSKDIYDALAPHYREYAEKKSAYIAGVDRFVLEHIPHGAKSLLDIGAGDGVRGMLLAQQMGISDIILCDYSPEMIACCKRLNPTEVWESAVEDLPDAGKRFDVIICLWNVLGHLPGHDERVRALAKMKNYLTDKGRIFFDVNNRHNAAAYGWLRVFGRILIDTVYFNEKRGDASFDWKIGCNVYPAMGHLFTPLEVERIVRESGLHVQRKAAVDYATGEVSCSPLRGQLLYLVAK